MRTFLIAAALTYCTALQGRPQRESVVEQRRAGTDCLRMLHLRLLVRGVLAKGVTLLTGVMQPRV